MKQKITILAAAILLMATVTNAKVWRVNNRPNVDADFTTLQAAIDSASAGDTLYIGASTTSYGNGIFDKKLIVIGAGYWLEENDTTQVYMEYSRVGRLTINVGSQGSTIEGLHIYDSKTNENAYAIMIYTDSILIRRNFIKANQNYNYNGRSANSIYINGNRNKIEIEQNWIYASGAGQSTKRGIYLSDYMLNSIIRNNFIQISSGNYRYSIAMAINSTSNELIINNNVMWGGVTTYYSIHVNNILVEGSYNNGTGDLASNNLCNGTQYPNTNNNQQNVDMSTVFVDYTKYIDNGYLLAPGSPATGAGINGGDCGAFGNGTGGDPYVLSGMPDIPTIFDATVTPIGTSSLPVNIKATSHN